MKRISDAFLLFTCLLLLTGCWGTLLYKPDNTVIKTMSFQEAKDKAESLFVQIVPRGSLRVYEDYLDISTPIRRDNCYFNTMPIEIKDFGLLAGGGEYPIGSRYNVSLGSGQGCEYIMFKDYEVAKTFANAVYVLKNTPNQAKESFFQALKQQPSNAQILPQTLPTALPIPTETAAPF